MCCSPLALAELSTVSDLEQNERLMFVSIDAILTCLLAQAMHGWPPCSRTTTGTRVFPDSLPVCSMEFTTSIPATTFPKLEVEF